MSKIKTNKKKNNLVFKIPSNLICPKCGDKYSFYISKKGNKKRILPGEYFYEGFLIHIMAIHMTGYTCGNY